MLQAMRRNSRHAIIYVLFGILIAAFVISFGPGSRGFGYSGPSSTYAAKVLGSTVSEQEFHFAYVALNFTMYPAEVARQRRLKEFVMDKLIERELFANEAERLGFNVSQKEAEDQIIAGKMTVMGVQRNVESYVYKDGKFDYERFKMVAQNQLGVSVKDFIQIQQRELLANQVRDALHAASKVLPDEVKHEFETRGLQVNLEFARYPERRYEEDIKDPSQAEIDAYEKAHAADIKKQYEERAFLYKGLERQAKIRHIVVEGPKSAPDDEVQKASKKADAAAAKLKAGADFAAVAKEFSTDERTKNRGGEMGWRKQKMTGFGEDAEKKLFAAKKGEVLGPLRTERGFEIVKVEDFREGDVPLADAEREIAVDEMRKAEAKKKARSEAQALVDRVKKGDKLEALVPKEEVNPNETPEERQMKAFMKKPNDPVKLEESGLFSKHGDLVQNIGISKELARRAFELKVGEVAGPFDAGNGFVVVRVKEHHEPDLADFEKRKGELIRAYERDKWATLVDNWSKQRCVEVRDDGRIKVNNDVLEYEVAQKSPVKYEPCAQKPAF